MGKISSKTSTGIPDPFSTKTHKTERTAAAVLMHWMRKIIEKNNLDLGLPDVETGGGDRRFPDTVIYATRRSQDILCVMEFKPPFWDPYEEKDPKAPAREKANKRGAKYFTTSNFRELILWDTEKVNALKPVEEQIVNRYFLSDIYDLDRLEDSRYRETTEKALEQFLQDLYQFSTGEKSKPRFAIDELLVYRLQEIIHRLAHHYEEIIYNKAHKEKDFAAKLSRWFTDQGWSFFIEDEQSYVRIARQTAYLLANKILFYNALQLKRPEKLAPLKIPDDITQGGLLQGVLQAYFDQVLRIDYETIYTTDFIDQVAFPDSREIVDEIKKLVNLLRQYDFSTLGYDVIGRIFERLIPPGERHFLGQYFTNPDVVDLILQFCLNHETDKIFDPSCGAGTFLVRAYQQKKLMNQRLTHEEILNSLWGNDIAKFPVHLSTINLAINDLSVEKNYPRIIQKDFFDLLSSGAGFELPEDVRKVLLKTMSGEELKIVHPHWFDAIVGNPPYTRQEEISEISGEETYKERLIEKALAHPLTLGRKSIDGTYAMISKRAGIYAYFFIHSTKFLQNGGRFGFVVSNAWLDVEYGAGLQEFFLKNYKIVAVIESKVERWFEDADINTCVVILEKADKNEMKAERNENLVRFVYLLKPLRHFVPPAQNIWERQVERKQAIENLIRTIKAHNDFYQNDELRIFPKKQSELWEEGFDLEEQKYVGSKWGKYIRAPEIFFTILEKGKDKLVPLKKIATVLPGCYSGINDFFYFDHSAIKKWKMEKDYVKPIIRTTRQIKKLFVNTNQLDSFVLDCHTEKEKLKRTAKGIFSYIAWGERQRTRERQKVKAGILYPSVETVKNRKPGWYSIPENNLMPTDLFMIYVINDRFICPMSDERITSDRCLHRVFPKPGTQSVILAGILNSSISLLLVEIQGRVSLGQGALKFETADANSLFVVSPEVIARNIPSIEKSFHSLANRELGNVFEEFGAMSPQETTLDKVKSDRRVLDQIIMGDVLGLTDEEQLEVYRAVIDLVKSRIERAKSVGKKKKTKSGIDVEAVVESVIGKIGEKNLGNWYKERVLSRSDLHTRKLPEGDGKAEIEKSLFGWQLKVGKRMIQCRSETEAHYLAVWAEIGAKSVKIPKDEKYLSKITQELEARKKELDEIIESDLGSILDSKFKFQLLHQIWQRIT